MLALWPLTDQVQPDQGPSVKRGKREVPCTPLRAPVGLKGVETLGPHVPGTMSFTAGQRSGNGQALS